MTSPLCLFYFTKNCNFLAECGSLVNNTLKSPGFPKQYGKNMDCDYSVPIPYGMAMNIVLRHFELEASSECR